jgi:hypothetical protein
MVSFAVTSFHSTTAPDANDTRSVVMEGLTIGAERTRPSWMIARFLSMNSGDTIPSRLVSESSNSTTTECADL